ncbi:MAG: HypC/HybG/HupF family hydrogenase formation chaperone [Desulfobacteraceae bacterium]|nr:HypC/HybG/HupF family hydrogenase formation chaperone [Desulfobacteraceae bacterium]
MCLAIPGEITRIEEGVATVRIGESLRKASLLLLPEEPKPGEYVIVHAGFALNVVDPEEAQESIRLIREMAACADEEPL